MKKESNIIVNFVTILLALGIFLLIAFFLTGKMTSKIFYDQTKKIASTEVLAQTADGNYFVYYYDSTDEATKEFNKQVQEWAEVYNYYVQIYLVDVSKEENASVKSTDGKDQINADMTTADEIKINTFPTLMLVEGTTDDSTGESKYDIVKVVQNQEEIMTLLNETGQMELEEATTTEH